MVFRKSNASVEWDGEAKSLLKLAKNAGLEPEFSYRSGICNFSKSTLVSGEVEYFELPLIAPEPGKVLICCSRQKGAVVLDI